MVYVDVRIVSVVAVVVAVVVVVVVCRDGHAVCGASAKNATKVHPQKRSLSGKIRRICVVCGYGSAAEQHAYP